MRVIQSCFGDSWYLCESLTIPRDESISVSPLFWISWRSFGYDLAAVVEVGSLLLHDSASYSETGLKGLFWWWFPCWFPSSQLPNSVGTKNFSDWTCNTAPWREDHRCQEPPNRILHISYFLFIWFSYCRKKHRYLTLITLTLILNRYWCLYDSFSAGKRYMQCSTCTETWQRWTEPAEFNVKTIAPLWFRYRSCFLGLSLWCSVRPPSRQNTACHGTAVLPNYLQTDWPWSILAVFSVLFRFLYHPCLTECFMFCVISLMCVWLSPEDL